MGDELVLRWCADCRAEQLFEVPPCSDGHDAGCPDLACTTCGAAAVLGIAETAAEAASGRSSAAA